MRESFLLITVASILMPCRGLDPPARISSHTTKMGDDRVLTCSLDTDLGQLCQWQTPGGSTLLINKGGKVQGNDGKDDGITSFNSPSMLQLVFSDASTDLYKMADDEFNSFPVYKNKDDSYIFVNCDGKWSLGGIFNLNYTHDQNNPTPISPPLIGWKPKKQIKKGEQVLEKLVTVEKSLCGIKIKEENISKYKGDWICRFHLEEKEEGEKGGFLGAVVSTEEKVTTNLRLAKHLKPIHYDLSLVADLLSNDPKVADYFGGKVVMKLEAQDTADYVMFHAEGLNIKHVEISSLDGVDREQLEIKGIIFDYERTLVRVYLKDSLFNIGKTYEVLVIYDSTLALTNSVWKVPEVGFYRQKCGDVLCWFTQFEGTFARRAFPCLDEPAMKATFSVSIARTSEWNALSNMPLIKTIPIDPSQSWAWEILNKTSNVSPNNNFVFDIFEPTVKMSTYLLAFTITDYAAVEVEHNHVSVWGPKNQIKQGRGNFSCETGSQLIDFFESYFKIKYSVPKTDMIALAQKSGAMENWGLITYDQGYLLSEPKTDRKDYARMVRLISHELAHEWLGNLVTAQWWNHIWLNEGMTHYICQYGVNYILPEAKVWDEFVGYEYFSVIAKDVNIDVSKTKSMSKNVITREEIMKNFGRITYAKGGIIVRMMEHILTTPVFLKGLRSYLSSLSFGNAVEEDLFNHLESAGIEDGIWKNEGNHSFSTSMMTWTDQAGVPLVTVTRNWKSSNETFSIKQSRFFYPTDGNINAKLQQYQSAISGAENSLWDIPISMTTVGGPSDDWNTTKPSIWLTTDQPQLEDVALPGLSSQVPVVLNVQRMGYFLVNYDEENWKLIGDALAKNKDDIHPYNRAQIEFDITVLANIGIVGNETKEYVLSYFHEEDNEVIRYIDDHIQYFENAVTFG